MRRQGVRIEENENSRSRRACTSLCACVRVIGFSYRTIVLGYLYRIGGPIFPECPQISDSVESAARQQEFAQPRNKFEMIQGSKDPPSQSVRHYTRSPLLRRESSRAPLVSSLLTSCQVLELLEFRWRELVPVKGHPYFRSTCPRGRAARCSILKFVTCKSKDTAPPVKRDLSFASPIFHYFHVKICRAYRTCRSFAREE